MRVRELRLAALGLAVEDDRQVEVERGPIEVCEGEEFGLMYEVMEISICNSGLEGFSKEPVVPGAVVSMGFESSSHYARRGENVSRSRDRNGEKVDERATCIQSETESSKRFFASNAGTAKTCKGE